MKPKSARPTDADYSKIPKHIPIYNGDDTSDNRISVDDVLVSSVLSFINEELAAWKGGVRSLSEAAKLIQSRVWIYVNE